VKIAGVTPLEKSNGRASAWMGRMLGKLKRKSSEAKK
jgi:hypothetical protein